MYLSEAVGKHVCNYLNKEMLPSFLRVSVNNKSSEK